MSKTVFIKINDPAHGWLRVTKQQLIDAHVTGLVTEYSYVDDEFVYLEEDCDMGMFLDSIEYDYEIQHVHTNKNAHVRSLKSYRIEETL